MKYSSQDSVLLLLSIVVTWWLWPAVLRKITTVESTMIMSMGLGALQPLPPTIKVLHRPLQAERALKRRIR